MAKQTYLLMLIFFLLATPIAVYGASVIINGGNLNNHVPTVYNVDDLKAPWSCQVTPNLRWHNGTSAFGVDFIYSNNGGIQADSAGINAYKQTGGWFQIVKVQARADGKVFVYLLQNSTEGTAIKLYESNTGKYHSGWTGVSPETSVVRGNPIFVAVSNNRLSVGEIKDTGIEYWVENLMLPDHGVGVEGITHVAGYGATYTTSGETTPATENGDGYLSLEFNTGLVVGRANINVASQIITALIPVVVLGLALSIVIKNMKKL